MTTTTAKTTFTEKNDNANSNTSDQQQQQQEALSPRNNENNNNKNQKKLRLIALLKKSAAAEVAKGDPWAKHQMHVRIPAERVVRHLYQASTKSWTSDETIVKMESTPFTHGAMRYCHRLKKRSALPDSASNHRFHDYGWTRACNYVAKTYHTTTNKNNNSNDNDDDDDNMIDTSEQAKEAVRNDISLQYEAAHWAERFNDKNPPKKIIFIRAYALEFPNRPGAPWFAVERFISGNDMYGCGFVKHNTNAGFVDADLEHRVTPQVFSAFTFYESHGERLVADIQGVGDLFTDPQVLSSDYRFGDGDLGPRGMALFFHSFRHNTLANSMGIPVFPLSRNELKRQAKYEDGADDCSSLESSAANSSFREACKHLDRFAAMDLNRSRRMTMAAVPPREIIPDELKDTERRSNANMHSPALSTTSPGPRDDVRNSLRQSCRHSSNKSAVHLAKPKFARHASDVDEVTFCLNLAKRDYTFDHKAYHRLSSGEMPAAKMNAAPTGRHRSSLLIRTVSAPMMINEKTRANLGKVHYQLAALHGMGRFPNDVPHALEKVGGYNDDDDDVPAHDVFSVLFHLAHAASMQNVAACLALGRLHAGLASCVSNLLQSIVPIDFDTAKDLLRRAMQSDHAQQEPACTKAAAGCLLYQIYMDEQEADDDSNLDAETTTTTTGMKASDGTIMHLLEDVLRLMGESEAEKNALDQHKKMKKVGGGIKYHVGDRVEGNYFLEGNYYPCVVESVAPDGQSIVVKYDDDGSTESLSLQHVRLIVPPTATQTALGGPLSDEEAFGSDANSDAKCFVEICELRAELAGLKEKAGNKAASAALYEEASNEAMVINKMKKAAEWSMKAASLME